MAMTGTRAVDIVRIGQKGDGEIADGLYVPFTVLGDRVESVSQLTRSARYLS